MTVQPLLGQRIAGGLYLTSAGLNYVLLGQLAFAQLGLGIALLAIRDPAKSEWLRFIVFAWVGFSLFMLLIAGFPAGIPWLILTATALFGVGVAGLMLSRLSPAQLAFFTTSAAAALALSIVA